MHSTEQVDRCGLYLVHGLTYQWIVDELIYQSIVSGLIYQLIVDELIISR